MKKAILLILVVLSFKANAQNESTLYKGFINGKLAVTMFIQSEENGCGDPYFSAMYKYDKINEWIQLSINKNNKEQYALVESNFTGLMILKKDGNTLKGIWISADGKQQFTVSFKEIPTTSKERDNYIKKMEEVNYQNHDC